MKKTIISSVFPLLLAVCLMMLSIPSQLNEVISDNHPVNTPALHNLDILSEAKVFNPNMILSFREHLPGFLTESSKGVVTFIDFSLPSATKRLWTVNLETGEILFNTFVAHGRNTGDNIAEAFSNTPRSNQSSLGFFITENQYMGRNGNSLRLRGLEKNINDKAFDRALVVHGAEYVSESFIAKQGRLGRSQGCPAIPVEITEKFIHTVMGGSLIFIYHPLYDQLVSKKNSKS